MASTGVAGAAVLQRYFCHQCDRTVTLTPTPTGELSCPICHGGFLEEFEIPTPTPNPNDFLSDFFPSPSPAGAFPSAFPLVFSASSSSGSGGPATLNVQDLLGVLSESLSPRPPPPPSADQSEAFNPLIYLQERIENLMAGGANIQFVIENHPSGDFSFPGGIPSIGDYFIGPGLEQLIQQLAENDPNRYGTPPASKKAVESLAEIKITESLLASDEAQCAVCKDTFEVGTKAKQMPCKHIYHKECILPWLDLHNSCPVCRYELPTDDPDYDHRARGTPPPQTAGGGNSGGAEPDTGDGGASGDGNSPRGGERSMRISLPWPLRTFGSLWGGGNSGAGGGNSSGDTNSGGRQGQNSGSETRQEDLD